MEPPRHTLLPSPRPASHRPLPWLVGAAALALGAAACAVYARQDLLLSHYDAKAHLVVGRRVIDSLTPGWQQIGAVWLPLPHLLNLLPVQIDLLYRTGASAIAISMIAFAVAAGVSSRLILDATRSRVAALCGTMVLVLNPDLLYLQATPMTESLLISLETLSVFALVAWVGQATPARRRLAGWLLAAACLCRYEAWPVTALALAGSTLARWRQGRPWREAVREVAPIAVYPVVAVALFLVHSRITIGEWFVSGGFFVAENPDMGQPVRAAVSVWWGTHTLSGYGVLVIAVIGVAMMILAIARSRDHAGLFVILALAGAAALPWYAFVQGHPFRIRYMVPLVPAVAVFSGVGIGLARRARWVAAAVLLVCVALETAPFDGQAPMVLEAQWDRGNQRSRQSVTSCLTREYRGEKIMASMGSLAHYMQELSRDGFALRDFLHEGNG
ncbi:MAG: hypothetical protein IMZ44_13665, partial [Planctomycetes bacterium]|nr:hypothetical protein [Planctomycetota bacterium]